EELIKLPPAHSFFSLGFRNFPLPSLSLLDSNRDGKVSRAELADYFRKNGGGPFRYESRPNFYREYALLDEELLLAEYDLRSGRSRPNTDTLNKAFFKLLDTNKDGKLSREELAAGPALLAKLDADDD